MKNLKYSIGVDVSMKEIVCCLSVINDQQEVNVRATHKFLNSTAGFAVLLKWVSQHEKENLPSCYVMEATGVYHEQLAWFLYSMNKTVCILLPTKAKNFLRANGSKSKNDSIDARGLAKIGAEKKLEEWTPPSEKLLELRDYTRQHQSLNELFTSTNNQLHSIKHAQFQNRLIIKQLEQTLRLIDSQIKELKKEILGLIQSDRILKAHYENITAIKGMGLMSFAVIAAETNGFTLFDNAASLVSYAGYDIVENQSGNHSGRTKISKKGNSRVRRVLLMPAFCAVRDDQPQFKSLFDRVFQRTKIKMKAYVAVQRKLLIMMYYLWKKNEKYIPQHYTTHETIPGELLPV